MTRELVHAHDFVVGKGFKICFFYTGANRQGGGGARSLEHLPHRQYIPVW